jgi:triosephosphate isomerase
MARVPCIGANWKCNGTAAENAALVEAFNAGAWAADKVQIVVCPTTLHATSLIGKFKDGISLGLQNCSATACGAYTGEVAASQVKDIGIEWVILGHSERRRLYNDTDEVLPAKLVAAQENGLNVIYCIGELLADREAGETNNVIEKQLKAMIPAVKDWSKLVIAYEPVWAIGTGVVATPEQAQDAHAVTRKIVADAVGADVANALRIQYGGSVSPGNCKELIALPDVDGFLVGGASLKPTFVEIIQAAAA